MRSEDVYIGARVRVASYGEPDLRGLDGTIEQVYGDPDYRAAEVRLENGRSELFWYHELESTPARGAGVGGEASTGIGRARV